MRPTIHTQALLQPGHKIELSLPELEDGETVDVIVVRTEAKAKGFTPEEFMAFLGPPLSTPGRRAEEIDTYLENERNSWD